MNKSQVSALKVDFENGEVRVWAECRSVADIDYIVAVLGIARTALDEAIKVGPLTVDAPKPK